jgi:hypothetical protein
MRKRFRVLLAILLVAIVGGIAWFVWKPREPVYQGKPLSFWLRGYDYPLYLGRPGPMPKYLSPDSPAQADAAVRRAGTNAIPVLSRLLVIEDSPVRVRVHNWLLNSKLRNFCLTQGFVGQAPRAFFCHLEAIDGIHALGTNASLMAPVLARVMRDENTDVMVRFWTAQEIPALGPSAREAILSLIYTATNWALDGKRAGSPPPLWGGPQQDTAIRAQCCYALVDIQFANELTVPALIYCLQDPYKQVQMAAMLSLGSIGFDARTATPALLEVIKRNSSPNPQADASLKECAERVLQRIDPEAAKKAGIKW